ncbi:FecCD family ABC transporter permease [Halalkalibacter hemicellulosilyticus]|uniref:Siderophore staphylobactin ABC transporter n=1 Tax=Halalkalibacter hemicellulosilyticusJCM 9152 TaxID=1236971 RepID=W4Q9R5_9BACI|nr:iron ABC transporter permease [Halalkalibacter hemicellulosilyticus]GAE28745.1 siderophore staphylobactin ABC transporter [Halalkalibacter hemicellulosilyticusJCM 9152]
MAKYFTFRTKSESVSIQIYKKPFIVLLSLVALTIFLFITSMSVGSSFIHPFNSIKHLFGLGLEEHHFVLHTLRLPRIVLSFFVGAALGVSGLILQGIIRNPLASPDIIGITGGATVGALTFIVLFAGAVSMQWLPLAAFLGAAIVSVVIYLLSWKKGVTPIRLVLIGIGVAATMSALTTMMIVLSDTMAVTRAYLWMTGSLYGANWQDVSLILPWVLIFIPLALFFSRVVDVKELGDEVAVGLGINVQLHRFMLLFVSVALAGAAVATAGGISFVGLMAPHIARMLAGRSFASLVFISAFIGGIIVIIADTVARTAFLPLDIPAGVFTAGIGAPFFIYLLYRNRNM